MSILLSIKPCFVKLIRLGDKTVELRKKMREDTNKIYVYESSPIQKVTGIIIVKEIKKLPVDVLWKRTKNQSCVSKEFFDEYFKNKKEGIGIFIKKFINIKPVSLKAINASPPQNYLLLSKEQEYYLEKSRRTSP